jgi:hypothetical protein
MELREMRAFSNRAKQDAIQAIWERPVRWRVRDCLHVMVTNSGLSVG